MAVAFERVLDAVGEKWLHLNERDGGAGLVFSDSEGHDGRGIDRAT
jgi:hypothetical protein